MTSPVVSPQVESMSEHTSTPWRAVKTDGYCAIVANDHGHVVTPTGPSVVDSRRITACVNACADIPTETLEAGNFPMQLAGILALHQERDGLNNRAELAESIVAGNTCLIEMLETQLAAAKAEVARLNSILEAMETVDANRPVMGVIEALKKISATAMAFPSAGVTCGEIARAALKATGAA